MQEYSARRAGACGGDGRHRPGAHDRAAIRCMIRFRESCGVKVLHFPVRAAQVQSSCSSTVVSDDRHAGRLRRHHRQSPIDLYIAVTFGCLDGFLLTISGWKRGGCPSGPLPPGPRRLWRRHPVPGGPHPHQPVLLARHARPLVVGSRRRAPRPPAVPDGQCAVPGPAGRINGERLISSRQQGTVIIMVLGGRSRVSCPSAVPVAQCTVSGAAGRRNCKHIHNKLSVCCCAAQSRI